MITPDTRPLRVAAIGELLVSEDPNEILVTYSLGSCIGLVAYDPDLRIGALAHFMLPLSFLDEARARREPARFVDTGMMALLRELYQRGARRERLVLKAAGAAAAFNDNGAFRIGERNLSILGKMLAKNGLRLHGEDTGGNTPRTLYLDMATGLATVRSRGKELPL